MGGNSGGECEVKNDSSLRSVWQQIPHTFTAYLFSTKNNLDGRGDLIIWIEHKHGIGKRPLEPLRSL